MVNWDGSANVRLECARAVVRVAWSREQDAPAAAASDDVATADLVDAASPSVSERPVSRFWVTALVGIVATTLQWACSDPASPPEQVTAPAPLAAEGELPTLLPAFPGADGWGATALNKCRSQPVEVLRVTNTDSEGPGSFNRALGQARDDYFTFILFRTGGSIVAPAEVGLRLNADCVYVAGQTAPGDGIAVEGRGIGFWLRGRGGNITDVVIRHIRFRGRPGQTRNNFIVAKGNRVVLDHLSFSSADDHLLAIMRYIGSGWSAPVRNLSLQNSILSNATMQHPTAFALAATSKDAPVIDMTDISIQRNLLAHNSHRNPMSAADNALIANNVIYNWRLGIGMMNRRGKVDWVNNYAKPGPMSKFRYSYVVNPYCNEYAGNGFDIYATGNIGPRSDDPDGDNWTGPSRQVACYNKSGGEPGHPAPASWRRDVPQDWASVPFPVSLLAAHEAYDTVVDDVGANARLACDGRLVSALDAEDARVLSDVQAGAWRSKAVADVRPSYDQGTPCQDTDDDGLPDAWEKVSFDCVTCADPAVVGRGGYLMIEHYLNATDPQ